MGSSPVFDDDDDAYSSDPATTYSGLGDTDAAVDEEPKRTAPQWHRGLDLGLLVLRLAIGGFFVAHGTDKLFGWFNDDMGMDATRQLLSGFGFTEPNMLAWVLALSETVGGVLVILGLFFPAGAAALLGVMANVIVVKGDWNLFLGDVEQEMTYAAAAFALLFTGPGRFALDRHTHWWRKAPAYGFVFLILAAGLTVVTLVVFR
jgi:putative oxidoreductase